MKYLADQHALVSVNQFCEGRDERFVQTFKTVLPTWYNWHVVNPRGDGKCMLYCIGTLLVENPDGDICDILLLLFLKGIKILLQEEGMIIFDAEFEPLFFESSDDDEMLVLKYLSLTQGQTISCAILRVFARATNTNFVLITYDHLSVDPLLVNVFHVPCSVTNVEGTMIEDMPKYRYILSVSGHNFALVPQNTTIGSNAFLDFERVSTMRNARW